MKRNLKLFQNEYSEQDRQLYEDGRCYFPLLNPTQITSLTDFFYESNPGIGSGFVPTMFDPNTAHRNNVSNFIIDVLSKPLNRMLSSDYEVLFGNYMVKYPGDASRMKIHQDWSYVQEPENSSFAIWVPLVDLSIENGALHMVPGSHRIENYERGPGLYCPFHEYSHEIEAQLQEVKYLKAGEAVCWNHRMVHSSPANNSNHLRIAVTVILVPRNTQVIHYFKGDESEEVECFRVEDDFFDRYEIGRRPKLELLHSKRYSPKRISLNNLYQACGNGDNDNLLQS